MEISELKKHKRDIEKELTEIIEAKLYDFRAKTGFCIDGVYISTVNVT